MRSQWSDEAARGCIARYAQRCGEDLALRTYTSRLIGAEPTLVLHGGGNTSVKGVCTNVFGERVDALFIKASGHGLATIEPEGHVAVDLAYLRRLRSLPQLADEAIANELRTHLFDHRAPTPSIETPVHAFIPGRFVDHTHADAVLALTNQPDGEAHVRRALGEDVVILPYVVPGFHLSKVVADACDTHPRATAMVWMRHGIITWGESAHESYERMIELVSRAEAYLDRSARHSVQVAVLTPIATAEQRVAFVAPIIRGLLAVPSGDPDRPFRRAVVRPLVCREVLDVVDAPHGRELALSPPLTADHLIRTRVLPAWIDAPNYDDERRLRTQLDEMLRNYASDYQAYFTRHAARLPAGVEPFTPAPRVVFMPGLGALCVGEDARAARIVLDITLQTLVAKTRIAAMGSPYQGLEEEHLFDMEYRVLQHAKLRGASVLPLAGHVTLVTGGAGAIGSAICERLLENGAHVAITDLPGPRLDELVGNLHQRFPDHVVGVPLDVRDAASVSAGFDALSRVWGGVDQVVITAGLAHVAGLDELEVERFWEIERVNVGGTLLLLQAATRHLKRQSTGGDIVLISTKNVFAPGARFGAYSATKAAAHQLARIASLELAEHGVRVNMVAPDAVFSHGQRRSGLWEEVGPDRMRARGLDAAGLEDYYRQRNLLKARVTADHVANAVLFFLTRQTPTTGATLPVDGGLPDATPR